MNPPDVYELSSESVGGGNDAAGLTDLGEKQQTPPPVLVIKGRQGENLYLTPWVVEAQGSHNAICSPGQGNR